MANHTSENCKLCGSLIDTMVEGLHDNRYGLPGEFSIRYCLDCALGETFPRPSFEDIPAIYEGAIGDKEGGFLKRLYRGLKRSATGTSLLLRLDRAGKFFGLLPPPSVRSRLLDIGCGSGDWLLFFEGMGFDAHGVDHNPRVVDTASRRGLKVRCERVEDLIAVSETYDVVVLSQLLEHLPDPAEVLSKVRRLLSPGGVLIVAVPNLDSRWRACFKDKWINWYMPFHIFHYTRKSLLKTLENSGFRTTEALSYTPSSWFLSSVMVMLFDRKGRRNDMVSKWWHFFLIPFVSVGLALYERLGGEGDCLCVAATTEDNLAGPVMRTQPVAKSLPLISVITPSFNQGRYIEETILSVVSQNYPNVEYMIIDGESKDETTDVIRKYENSIDYWVSESDEGQSDAINKGLVRATGDIIAWLNSDDQYCSRDIFRKVAEFFIANPGVDVCYGNNLYVDKDSHVLYMRKAFPYFSRELLRAWNFIHQPTVFMRRRVMDDLVLSKDLNYIMDYELWLRLSRKYNFKYIDLTVSASRWHADCKTMGGDGSFFSELKKLHAEQGKGLAASVIPSKYLFKFFYSIQRLYTLPYLVRLKGRERFSNITVNRWVKLLRRQVLGLRLGG